MKKYIKILLVMIPILLISFSGCGDKGTEGAVTTGLIIEGRVAKGSISGATIEVFDTTTGDSLGVDVTDSQGYYSIKTSANTKGVVRLTANGGSFIDEQTGNQLDASAFELVAVQDTTYEESIVNINITPFTTVSYKKLIADGKDIGSKDDVTKYNKAIASIFVGNKNIEITKLEPNIVNDANDNHLDTDDQKNYGTILAAFSGMIQNTPVLTTSEINNIVGKIKNIEYATIEQDLASHIQSYIADINTTNEQTDESVNDINNSIEKAVYSVVPNIIDSAPNLDDNIDENSTKISWIPVTKEESVTSCKLGDGVNLAEYNLTFDSETCAITGEPNATHTGKDIYIIPSNPEGEGLPFSLNFKIDRIAQAPISFVPSDKEEFNVTDGNFDFDITGGTCDDLSATRFVSSDTDVAKVNISTGIIDINTTGIFTLTATKTCSEGYLAKEVSKTITVLQVLPNIATSTDINASMSQVLDWNVTNTGGSIDSCAIDTDIKTLYNLDFDQTTCAITGVPNTTNIPVGIDVSITATNSIGDNIQAVHILINSNPNIDNPQNTIGIYNTPVVWDVNNTGSNVGMITSCEITPNTLKNNYNLDFNQTNCQITGEANKTTTGDNSYTITAKNISGNSAKNINIVIDRSPQDPILFDPNTKNEFNLTDIDFDFGITGGNCSGIETITYNSNDTAIADVNTTTGVVNMQGVGEFNLTATKTCSENYLPAVVSKLMTVHNVVPDITNDNNITTEYNTTIATWRPSNTGGTITGCALDQDINSMYGLDFNDTTCAISGEPNATIQAGINIGVTASNEIGDSNTIVLQLIINKAVQNPIVDMTNNNANCYKGTSPIIHKDATGGSSSFDYNYTSSDTNIATVDPVTGVVSCIEFGEANITATRAEDDNWLESSHYYTIVVSNNAPNIDNPQNTTGIYNEAVVWDVNNSGANVGPIESCEITPNNLKATYNLDFNQTTCQITGIPSASTIGDSSWTIKAINTTGNSTKNINIVIDKAEQNPFGFDNNLTIHKYATGSNALDHIGNGTGVIEFKSLDEDFAVVDSGSGDITQAKQIGDVQILATKGSSDNFKETNATYTLTIIDADPNITTPNDISIEYNETFSWMPDKTNSGEIDNCSILPVFAANSGLEINNTTCEITGAPLFVKESGTEHTITATNKAGVGVDTTIVDIVVVKAEQQALIIPQSFISDIMSDIGHQQVITGGSGDGNITFSSAASPTFIDLNTTTGAVVYKKPFDNNKTIIVLKKGNDFYKNKQDSYKFVVGDFIPNLSDSIAATSANFDELNNTLWEPINTGGNTTYDYTTNPALPAGLTIHPTTGIIGGTPQSAQDSAPYEVNATNASGTSLFVVNITINKVPQPNFRFNDGNRTSELGTSFEYNVTNIDAPTGTLTYTTSDPAKALVTNSGVVTINDADTKGNVTITARNQGDGNYSSTVATYIITIIDKKPNIANPMTSEELNTTYMQTIPTFEFNNTGGPAVSCITVGDDLPTGLEVNVTAGGNCVITGTPTEVKTDQIYTIRAIGEFGDESTKEIHLFVDKAHQTGFDIVDVDKYLESVVLDFNRTGYGGNTTLDIQYTSSNETIALVGAITGVITPKTTGNVTITATKPGNVSFYDANASYKLIVQDTLRPVVDYAISTPTDDEADANATANLIIVWNDNISINDGKTIRIKSDGDTNLTITYSTTDLVIVGDRNITLDLGNLHLSYGEEHYIYIEANSVADSGGNVNDAIDDQTSWNFSVLSDSGPCKLDCVDNCDNY